VSLGLPSHLSARATSSASVKALQAVGMTCLATAFFVAAAFQLAQPDEILWPAMIAVVPVVVLLWLHGRRHSLFLPISFLGVGAVCVYWYLVTFFSQIQPILPGDGFAVDLPLVALMMVGGPGVGLLRRFGWCAAGFLAGQVALGAALAQTANPFQVSWPTLTAFVVITGLLFASWLGRQRTRQAQPLLHRAARDEQLASLRDRMESKAAALMHDTVLSHLAAIAATADDRLRPELTSQIERDLEVLIGEEWLAENPAEDEKARKDWRQSTVFAAIQEVAHLGLDIESTGDFASVSRIDREAAVAVGLAVKQCLINVLRHSGTMRAEVVAFGSEGEVSVMVIDAGKGFSEGDAGADRLGLRTSVRERMEAVGGSVHVWSTPGHGTSIMLRVPVGARSETDGTTELP
jgi:signal transduction histidine kinase